MNVPYRNLIRPHLGEKQHVVFSVQSRSEHVLRIFFNSLRSRSILIIASLSYFSFSGYLIFREHEISLSVLTMLACALTYSGIACLTPKDRMGAGDWRGLAVTLFGGVGVLTSLHLEHIIDSEWYFFEETKAFSLILIDVWLP